MTKIVERLAAAIAARLNCIESGNAEWQTRHEDTIDAIVRDRLPSGSGVDSGTAINLDKCTPDKIVLFASFHHMNDGGYYDGWTQHTITVTPSFIGGFSLKISGPNRNQVKDYLGDLFHAALNDDYEAQP